MGLFGSKPGPFDAVTRISMFPSIGSVVLRKDDKLIVFSPGYLMGKHATTSGEVASKFMNLKTATQLLELVDKNISASKLSGSRVEIKEVDFGYDVGTDALVKLPSELQGVVPVEKVRNNDVNIVYAAKGRLPRTKLLNIILVAFDPKYGNGVEKLFQQKYGYFGFEKFAGVYAIMTIFPGKYAPAMNDTGFWREHALLKEMP